MGSRKVTIDNLASEITKAMREYTDEVSEAIEQEKEDTAKAIADELKKSTAWADRTGKYRKGFNVKKKGTKGNQSFIVHNKNKPQITHILELGHVKRGGGRVAGRPHFRPIADKHLKALEQRIEKIIENGGR